MSWRVWVCSKKGGGEYLVEVLRAGDVLGEGFEAKIAEFYGIKFGLQADVAPHGGERVAASGHMTIDPQGEL